MRVFGLIILICVTTNVITIEALDDAVWTQINPTLSAAVISPVAYGNGVMVAFGYYSWRIQLLVSKDLGITWEDVPLDQSEFGGRPFSFGYVVTFCKKFGFIAVPTFIPGVEPQVPGPILMSQNGYNWSSGSSAELWFGVLASNGNSLVSAGDTPVYFSWNGIYWENVTIYFSSNGKDWENTTYSDTRPAGVTYVQSLNSYLIYGHDLHDIIMASTSSTGDSYSIFENLSDELGINVSDVSHIIESDFGLVVLVVVNNTNLYVAIFHTNTFRWSVVSNFPGTYGRIAHMNNIYCLAINDPITESLIIKYSLGPSSNWTWQNTTNGISIPQAIPEGNVWMGTVMNPVSPGIIQRSTDGINWTTFNNGIVDPISSSFYTNVLSAFVIGTYRDFFVSDDGISWKKHPVNAQLFYDPSSMTILGFSDTFTGYTMFITKDLVNFTTIELPNEIGFIGAALDSVNNMIYVSCMSCGSPAKPGIIFYRYLDSIIWNSYILPGDAEACPNIIAGNGVVIAEGHNFANYSYYWYLYSSKNGKDWETTLTLTDECLGLTFCGPKGSERFFLVCGTRDSYTSADGFKWEKIQGDVADTFGISYDENWGFVATQIGNYSVSSDGVNFVLGEIVTDVETLFTSFVCSMDKCILVSEEDNSIFITPNK